MTVPYAFANATTSIQLSQLDANFDTPITLGNTAIQLGNTVTTLNNMTLANATFSTSTVISVNTSSDALRITQLGAGNALVVEDSANPDSTPFVIDADGKVIIGTTIPATTTYPLLVESTAGIFTSAGTNSAATSPTIGVSRRRTSLASVISGDSLGKYSGFGWDAASFVEAARIEVAVDGTPGTNDMPGRLVFSTTADGASSPTERMRIDSAGNIGIGTTAPAGQALRMTRNITGSVSAYAANINPTFQSDVTTGGYVFQSIPSTQATAFTMTSLRHFYATQGTIGAGSTVTNQYGFTAESTLTGATNNYGFYSNIASGTGRWNFYAAGTADNYFAGNVGVGSTTPSHRLSIYSPDAGDNLSLLNLAAAGAATGGSAAQATFVASSNLMTIDLGPSDALVISNNGTEATRVTSGGGFLISRTTVTSPVTNDGNVFSGTYTPTLTNTTNITSSTAFGSQYMRVGNVVTVSGRVTIDPTATGSITLGVSLPIASTIANTQQCCGTSANAYGDVIQIIGDATNLRATFTGTVADAGSRLYAYSFTYLVV